MKLTLEIHLVMRIKDKSNCGDEANAMVMRIKDQEQL